MQVDSVQSTEVLVNLSSWGISEYAIAVLATYPDKVAELQEVRALPQLPADFVPTTFEVKFDGIAYLSWELSNSWRLAFERKCSPEYQPDFVEYCFDGQTIFLHVNGEIVVSRIDDMALEKENLFLATIPIRAS